MDRRTARIAGLSLAPIGCVTFLILYAVAAFNDPGYTFFEDYLSDLGVGPAAWAFNSGVIIAGLLMALFSVFGLHPSLEGSPGAKVGSGLFALAGVFLVNIGIFTEDAGDTHTFFSFAFFLTALASFGALTASMHLSRGRRRTTLYATALTFAAGVCLLPTGATPSTETVAVLLILSWVLVVPALMLVRAYPSSEE